MTTQLKTYNKVKLDPEGFNDLPDASEHMPLIGKLEGLGFEAADLRMDVAEYWQNSSDTLVMRAPRDLDLTVQNASMLTRLVMQLSADEFDYGYHGDYHWIRLWWD